MPLGVFPGTNLNALFANRFSFDLSQFQDFGDKLKFQCAVSANSTEVSLGRIVSESTSAALRITFDADSKVLTAYYDENGPVCGYSWSFLGATEVPASWNMKSDSVFGFGLVGSSQGASVASIDNAFFDNFLVTSGPDPSLNMTRTGNEVVLSWVNNGPAVHLEFTSTLTPPICWQVVPGASDTMSPHFSVTNTISDGTAFFRLSR